MKQLLTILVLLFIFSCETEPLDGFDGITSEEASLIFPEAECGEVAVEIDGEALIFNEDVKATNDGYCQLNLWAIKNNPDGSTVSLFIRISNTELGEYILEDHPSTLDYCEQVRVYLGYYNPADPDSSEGYSSYPDRGGEGLLTISELIFDFGDDVDDYITGTFEVTGGLVGDPDAETLSFIGSFNKVPIAFVCGTYDC